MRRSTISITCATVAFLLLTFLLKTQAMTNQRPDVIAAPVFAATMAIIPSQRQVAISDTLVVTVSISVSEGCMFPIYELTLQQFGNDGLIFEYLSPPTHTVGPGVTNPYSYTLTAVSTGTVAFGGQAYGERYCFDFWNWTYVNGQSDFVRVGEWPYRIHLPTIFKN